MARRATTKKGTGDNFLEGKLLLAMPTMTDKRFKRAVIYMCRHSKDEAMGIIVNHPARGLTIAELLRQLEILEKGDRVAEDLEGRQVHIGGPVSTERGFVLHTPDLMIKDSTLKVSDGRSDAFCLTATVEILRAIAKGAGPERSILALGYSGWAGGQLESEIQANGWLHCPAHHDLVFAEEVGEIYERALGSIGVNPGFLASSAGHA